MAIEGFGESLLGEKRARDTKRRKKEQTYDTLGAAASIGIGMYRNSLAEKQKDFLNSEQVMAQKAIRMSADSKVKGVYGRETDINNFGVGAREEFFLPQVIEQLKVDMLRADPSQKINIQEGAHDNRFREEGLPLARQFLKNHDLSLNAAKTYASAPSMANELEVANKRPDTVFGAALNIFKPNTSSEELNQQTIDSYRTSKGSLSAENLLSLEKGYAATRNLVAAHEYKNANFEVSEAEKSNYRFTTTKNIQQTKDFDGVQVEGFYRSTQVVDKLEQIDETSVSQFIPYIKGDKILAEKDKVAVKANNAGFNIQKNAETNLSQASQIKYGNAARIAITESLEASLGRPPNKGEVSTEMYLPSTMKNYNILSATYDSLNFQLSDYKADMTERAVAIITAKLVNNPVINRRIELLNRELDQLSAAAGTTVINGKVVQNPISDQDAANWQLKMDKALIGSIESLNNNVIEAALN